MKKQVNIGFVVAALFVVGCHSNNPQNKDLKDSASNDHYSTDDKHDHSHNSQNSLDWEGVYEGIIPCADCPGIKTTVELKDNEQFKYSAEYVERKTTLVDSGKIMWHENGSVVHLHGKDIDVKYKVGENRLFQLDSEGKPIDGPNAKSYNLQKK